MQTTTKMPIWRRQAVFKLKTVPPSLSYTRVESQWKSLENSGVVSIERERASEQAEQEKQKKQR